MRVRSQINSSAFFCRRYSATDTVAIYKVMTNQETQQDNIIFEFKDGGQTRSPLLWDVGGTRQLWACMSYHSHSFHLQ